MKERRFESIVVAGHQVASGRSTDSPYPGGTIAMQKPFFQQRGLDLSGFFDGTLNLQLPVSEITLCHADYYFEKVNWAQGFAAEDFSLVRCQLTFHNLLYAALVYYPHPETKLGHFQATNILEVLAPPIVGIHYQDRLTLHLPARAFRFVD